LFEAALKARLEAHAPYSRFKVGASLLSGAGKIYTGCNVENASFALTCCAEKTAVVKAVSEGERDFKAILIVADSQKPVMPCGSCRQVLYEFSPQMTVIVANLTGEKNIFPLENLLPEAFSFER